VTHPADASPTGAVAAARTAAAPPATDALAALRQRTARAVASMLVRLVAVAVLDTILNRSAPGLRPAPGVLDAVGALLVLWPFFTALGRIYAWRIALGRAYVREMRWSDAQQALAPFVHPRVRLLFDATGEGTYLLATARRADGHKDLANRLLRQLAAERRGCWSEAAASHLDGTV
jgi:hypothetical protein